MVIRPDFHHFVKGDALVTIGGAVGVEATLSEESCRSQLMAGPGATPAPWGGSQCWRRRSRRCSIPSPLRASTPASRASRRVPYPIVAERRGVPCPGLRDAVDRYACCDVLLRDRPANCGAIARKAHGPACP